MSESVFMFVMEFLEAQLRSILMQLLVYRNWFAVESIEELSLPMISTENECVIMD